MSNDSKSKKSIDIIEDAMKKLGSIYGINQEDRPEYLYHYTTIEGFKGIYESNSLWISNTKFMNDSREYIYGRDILLNYIQELEKSGHIKTGYHKDFIKYLSKELEQNRQDMFLISLCTEPDLLSQWRGYAQGTTGISLGFNMRDLCTLGRDPKEHDYSDPGIFNEYRFPQRVIYDKYTQKKIVVDSIDIALKACEDYYNLTGLGKTGELCFELLRYDILRWLLLFKDPGFREENEWRIIFDKRETKVKFRVRDGVLLPYIEIKAITKDAGKVVSDTIPINKIIVGPSRQKDYIIDSINYFLESEGKNIEVISTEIPYR